MQSQIVKLYCILDEGGEKTIRHGWDKFEFGSIKKLLNYLILIAHSVYY